MITYLFASIFIPLIFAAFCFWRPLDPLMRWTYAWTPLPALLLAIHKVPIGSTATFPNLLLGIHVGLDGIGLFFLILTALVWIIAGVFAQTYISDANLARTFRFYFLMTMCGNLGLTVAEDALTFYMFFAVMTISGYGLVAHTRNEASFLSGRFYITYAFVGELLIFSGLILSVYVSESIDIRIMKQGISNSSVSKWIYGLFILGFGTKVGLVPIHAWLPRSYYAASLPAAAILSGAMSKAGVLGYLRFLPIGEATSAHWSLIIIGFGAVTALYGALVGLVQTRARTTLAFSSLSQMGYLTMAVGVCLEPGVAANAGLAAIVVFAFHHGLTKVALFLGIHLLTGVGTSVVARYLMIGALGLLSLSLIGVPYLGGAYAKFLLKGLGTEDGWWHTIAPVLLTLGSTATALLMTRFMVLCIRLKGEGTASTLKWIAWITVFILSAASAWSLPQFFRYLGHATPPSPVLRQYLSSFWPVILLLIPSYYMMKNVLLQQSQLTPRPLDGALGWMQQTFGIEWPQRISQISRFIAGQTRRFIASLQLERRSHQTIAFASRIHTSWRLGSVMLLAVWLAIWVCLIWEAT